MLTTRRTSVPLREAVPELAFDEAFPRAVTSEEYGRYAVAMAQHADRWLQVHLSRLSGVATEPAELRDRLRHAAVIELRRELHTHEERLLSEAFQRRPEWDTSAAALEPEVPSFLVKPMALR
jgi:hypothetical protein